MNERDRPVLRAESVDDSPALRDEDLADDPEAQLRPEVSEDPAELELEPSGVESLLSASPFPFVTLRNAHQPFGLQLLY
jgi:hypothetical protein